jgi:hypothetical protein
MIAISVGSATAENPPKEPSRPPEAQPHSATGDSHDRRARSSGEPRSIGGHRWARPWAPQAASCRTSEPFVRQPDPVIPKLRAPAVACVEGDSRAYADWREQIAAALESLAGVLPYEADRHGAIAEAAEARQQAADIRARPHSRRRSVSVSVSFIGVQARSPEDASRDELLRRTGLNGDGLPWMAR